MELVNLRERGGLAAPAAAWFHDRWGIPARSYRESMDACLAGAGAVPQWYLALQEGRIIGGAGVIENDFHLRRDLRPNLCALWVEEGFRRRGVAGALLAHACADMARLGCPTLYLVTEHTSFYERYGWQCLCMVPEADSPCLLRMYRHRV